MTLKNGKWKMENDKWKIYSGIDLDHAQ